MRNAPAAFLPNFRRRAKFFGLSSPNVRCQGGVAFGDEQIIGVFVFHLVWRQFHLGVKGIGRDEPASGIQGFEEPSPSQKSRSILVPSGLDADAGGALHDRGHQKPRFDEDTAGVPQCFAIAYDGIRQDVLGYPICQNATQRLCIAS